MADLKDMKVLVTATSFGKTAPAVKAELEASVGKVIYNPNSRPLTSSELASMIGDTDGLIAGLDTINEEVIKAATNLKVIARYGVGYEKVDLAAATSKRIIVTNTPGANASSVAELTIGFMLALARDLINLDKSVRNGEWRRHEGMSIRGKTIGLVGLGAIGTEVAKRLFTFDCKLIGYDPYTSQEHAKKLGVKLVDLQTLAGEADIISLHAPVNPNTTNMIDDGFLIGVKRGAILINTARGQLINEGALIRALETGQIAKVALDAFAEEPLKPGNSLLNFPQVLLTPHIGAHTDDAVSTMSRVALDCCLSALKGLRPPNILNPQVFK